jgi:hypothetical protein
VKSVEVRSELVKALQLDLIGPDSGLGQPDEVLTQAPSRWYLTGFLVPIEGGEHQRSEDDSEEELTSEGDNKGTDDNTPTEKAAARRAYLPSSIGMSLLIPAETKEMKIVVRWGDYLMRKAEDGHGTGAEWQRQYREESLTLTVPVKSKQPTEQPVPSSDGLAVALSVRPVNKTGTEGGLPKGTRSLSLFLVNRRKPAPDETKDQAFAFQAQLEATCIEGFVSRPNLQSLGSDNWDELVADLQYRDDRDYAVGHNIATHANVHQGICNSVKTVWIPQAEVEKVAASKIEHVELSMDALGQLQDGNEASEKMLPLVTQYRQWLKSQEANIPTSPVRRKTTAQKLLGQAEVAAKRIEAGIKLLQDKDCLEAFRIANLAMAHAAKRRQGVMAGKPETSVKPEWRPFQLAFLLMNLPGIADPTLDDREVVDLLFFPTGGGKTEAYLGLAAFTLVLRRLRNKGVSSAGLSVLMRYTLRLLTLDQLGRASTLICALELIRQQDVEKLGEWPFEIGLWVGQAATPNRMGNVKDKDPYTARAKTVAYQNGEDRKPSPIPLEGCPWCGKKFAKESFQLFPNRDYPTDLRINCLNRDCAFSHGNSLPIVAVDEPIFRRLPCFMIATVDKFAAMPWVGPVGAFFGKVDRHDKQGFYGPCQLNVGAKLPAGKLLPPDLVIQDELHLISGPLGTMAGLYETAIDTLSMREENGKTIRPKIIASTATVRRAQSQIQALFNHKLVDIFPPPGPDRHDSFFAETHPPSKSNARMYLGIAAQGRSPKVVMLRCYLALLAAAQKWYATLNKKGEVNPADPYMTLVGYFNSLRELGGARRVVEDEVGSRLLGYDTRKRLGEDEGLFYKRQIAYEVVELTSRESTSRVSEAKRRLEQAFQDKEHVDVALATNMISVGLDIVRLGLMVVFGQPKTSAEYIQSTSRVGRDEARPGLVITILNIHKPRDRSHYERFCYYHQTFYRSVEATSVTPFSPRALDRGLAGTLVALARQGLSSMTAPKAAQAILTESLKLNYVVEALQQRAEACGGHDAAEKKRIRENVRNRSQELLDVWSTIAHDYQKDTTVLQYNESEGGAAVGLLHNFLDQELKKLAPRFLKFRANRSLRDVEPSVNLWLKTMDGIEMDPPEEDA